MPADKVETIRPKLQQAQRALEAALDEACEADVSDADSGTLMRLEESLTEAREAARKAITLIQRLDRQERELIQTSSEEHRVFIDESGVQWDVFAVHPSRAMTGKKNPLPPTYHAGWLSIQCSEEIRRLAPIPEGWSALSRAELCKLLEAATKASRRKASQEKESQSDASPAP